MSGQGRQPVITVITGDHHEMQSGDHAQVVVSDGEFRTVITVITTKANILEKAGRDIGGGVPGESVRVRGDHGDHGLVTPAPTSEKPRSPLAKSGDHQAITSFVVPITTRNSNNTREHPMAVAKRNAKHRKDVRLMAPLQLRSGRWKHLPCVVTLTRVSPRELDEGDNLPQALKSVRDEVASMLGIDDRDKRVAWVYHQVKGKPPEVRITLESVP